MQIKTLELFANRKIFYITYQNTTVISVFLFFAPAPAMERNSSFWTPPYQTNYVQEEDLLNRGLE